MKGWAYFIGGFAIVLALMIIVRAGLTNEDDWIKDEKGVYIPHGQPSFVPDYVLEQREAMSCAFKEYNKVKINGSTCLGQCGSYSAFINDLEKDTLKAASVCNKSQNLIRLDIDGNLVEVVYQKN